MCNYGVIHLKSAVWNYGSGGRRAVFWFALFASVFASSTFAAGQSTESPSTPAPSHAHAKKPALDDHVQKLAKALDLNETQQSEVKRILERQQESIRRLRDQTSPTGADWVTRLHAIHAQTIAQIRPILNDEQRKKYDAFVQPQTQNSSTPPNVEDWLKPAKPK